MLRKLLEKVFGVKITKVVKEEKKKDDYCATGGQAKQIIEDEITKEQIDKQTEQISDAIIALGYKAIPDILRANHPLAVEKWLMFKMMELDIYQNESTNLEELNMDEMIALAEELNLLSYRKRMIEEGKAKISKEQMKLFKDTLNRCKKIDKNYNKSIPTDKFTCSDDIDEMFKFINANKIMVGNITDKQYKKLKFQCKTLGIDYKQPASIAEASELIAKLDKEIEAKGIDTTIYATEPQIDTAKRYYRLLGKRWTKQSLNKWAKMPIGKASEEISKLKELYLNSKASSDRMKYVKDLAKKLNAPLAEDLTLTNREANKLTDKFKRQILNKMAEVGYVALTSEEIAELNPSKVSELIKQIQIERKTKYFEKNAEEIM